MLGNVFGPEAAPLLVVLVAVVVGVVAVLRRVRRNGGHAPDRRGKRWSPAQTVEQCEHPQVERDTAPPESSKNIAP